MRVAAFSVSVLSIGWLGCGGPVDVSDDLGDNDVLHTPYVVGAATELRVRTTGLTDNTEDWRLGSSDPLVFDVETRRPLCIFGCNQTGGLLRANGVGTADLRVFTNGQQLRPLTTRVIEVVIPDDAALLSGEDLPGVGVEGAERLREVVLALPTEDVATVPFLVDMRRGDDTVFGVGRVQALFDGPSSVSAEVVGSTRAPGRAWLQLTPNTVGRETLSLAVDGERFASVAVEVIEVGDIARLSIEDGGGSSLRAVAVDAQERRVFGIEPSWSLNGIAFGSGHVMPVQLEPGSRTLRVCIDDQCAERVLNGLIPLGVLDGRELPPRPPLGCSEAGWSGAPAFAMAALLAFLGRRRTYLSRNNAN